MDIYAILIILALGALVAVAWIFAQKLEARYRNIEREAAYIKNTLEKLSSQVEFYGSETNKAVAEKLGALCAPSETPAPADGDIVSRVETTLKEIQGIALGMKDAAPAERETAAVDDAKTWQTITALRADAVEARDALDRSQKRLRQLGDCLEDASRKLRALERGMKQFKRRDRISAVSPVESEPDEMDMKL